MVDGRVILVNSGNAAFHAVMPLGVMAVATALQRRHGLNCRIIDLPNEQPEQVQRQVERFWRSIDLAGVWFVGFSTMCNTLPRSLSLARALRSVAPRMPIVFGGPEASMNARRLMDAYDFIDAVVVGEAEAVLPDLVEWLQSGRRHNRHGLWFGMPREPGGGEPDVPEWAPPADLNGVEQIDYGLYPQTADSRQAAIDAGRGCPYDCSYCSTKQFFGRRFRLKSPERIVEEVTGLVRGGHVDQIDFVHDMLTANRQRTVELCQALVHSGLAVRWSCSARPDRLDAELLGHLSQAGCRDIFAGLETGSDRLQTLINKKLDLTDSLAKLRAARDFGINVTTSLIVGFPQEEEEDLAATLTMALRLLSWRPRLKSVQLHLLAPLAGTRLTDQYRAVLRYDGYRPALTSVNRLTEWEEIQVRTRPDLFSSFYYFRNPSISRSTYKWLYTAFATVGAEVSLSGIYPRYGKAAGAALLDWARRHEGLRM